MKYKIHLDSLARWRSAAESIWSAFSNDSRTRTWADSDDRLLTEFCSLSPDKQKAILRNATVVAFLSRYMLERATHMDIEVEIDA